MNISGSWIIVSNNVSKIYVRIKTEVEVCVVKINNHRSRTWSSALCAHIDPHARLTLVNAAYVPIQIGLLYKRLLTLLTFEISGSSIMMFQVIFQFIPE